MSHGIDRQRYSLLSFAAGTNRSSAQERAANTLLWLIRDLQIYLNGFSNRGIQPKAGKDSQKCGGGKYAAPLLTTLALTMPRRLRGLSWRQPMSGRRSRPRP